MHPIKTLLFLRLYSATHPNLFFLRTYQGLVNRLPKDYIAFYNGLCYLCRSCPAVIATFSVALQNVKDHLVERAGFEPARLPLSCVRHSVVDQSFLHLSRNLRLPFRHLSKISKNFFVPETETNQLRVCRPYHYDLFR